MEPIYTKIKKYKKLIFNNYNWIILFVGVLLFIVILKSILIDEIQEFDRFYYEIVSKSISNSMTPIVKFITNLGSWFSLVSIAFILFIIVKDKKIKYAISINLMVSSLLNFIVKNIIQRPRPIDYRIIEEKGYSFPSGHSMSSMAFYGFLIYLIFKNVKNTYIKTILIFLLSVLIFLIGTSRIYLGVHYTSDVIGGFLLAISYLMIYTGILKYIKK